MKKLLLISLAVILLIILSFILKPSSSTKTLFGIVGYTPVGFPNAGVEEMSQYFKDINQYSNVYGINSELTEAEQLAALFTRNISKPLILVLGYKDVSSTEKIINILKENPNVKYLGLGNEVNLIFKEDETLFDSYLANYLSSYDKIKAINNHVKIFPVFQYEALIGKGKIMGGENQSNIELINRFAKKIDLIGLTLYPHFDYATPQDIPTNYFEDILRFNLPIGVTETSWPSSVNAFSGDLAYLNTTTQEQKDYVGWINMQDKNKFEFINWLFLNDIDQNNQAFKGSALRDKNGISKPSFDEWIKLK